MAEKNQKRVWGITLILTKIILNDYGIYQGKNIFDFTCTRQKPIILIGGTNGAGKTTLFESVPLCLYGISFMGKRTTQKSYEQFLARKIHRYLKSATHADFASIMTQFKFFHDGKEIEYQVTRMWKDDDGKIIETLTVKKYDKNKFIHLDTVEQSHWQSFIEDLIPKGIIRLFFFDGEKIAKIAKEGKEDITIKESFNSLLGLDLVGQLSTDLQVNLARNLNGNDKHLRDGFERYKAEKDESVNIIIKLEEKLAQKQTEMDALCTEIDSIDRSISKIGGNFAQNRDQSKADLATKTIILETIKNRMHESCSKILPFSMMPAALETLSQQIKKDELLRQQKAGNIILKSTIKIVNSKLSVNGFWNEFKIEQTKIKKINKKISILLNSKIKNISDEKPVLDFSPEQASRIESIIQESNTIVLEKFKRDAEKIIEVSNDITKIQTSMANAPNDDAIGPLISKFSDMNSQKGVLQAEMDHIEEKISNNTAMKKHIDVKLRDIISQMYKTKKAQLQVELTQKIQNVLEEFAEELKKRKIQLLEDYMMESISMLMHKKNFIEKITINPETFNINLFRKNNDPFPKDLLSEGEKQMLATAILWALAKTSGRPLPFMIDTPLARLDASHRHNIVEKFLPLASHQVVILSTDKEIENEDYKKIREYTSRSYVMEYCPENGITKINDGYFWNGKGEKIVAV